MGLELSLLTLVRELNIELCEGTIRFVLGIYYVNNVNHGFYYQ